MMGKKGGYTNRNKAKDINKYTQKNKKYKWPKTRRYSETSGELETRL